MACACSKRVRYTYVWTDGNTTIPYDSEVVAKAKVIRSGGTYEKVAKSK